jgi:hypothetical protein
MVSEFHRNLAPGDRCVVFDSRLFVDDKTTPLSVTLRPATVLRRYSAQRIDFDRGGYLNEWVDLVDVAFDHSSVVSRGHFTTGVRPCP